MIGINWAIAIGVSVFFVGFSIGICLATWGLHQEALQLKSGEYYLDSKNRRRWRWKVGE